MENGLLIGTFLPFHRGHEYLINFAKNVVGGKLVVVVSSRSFEPIGGDLRVKAIEDTFIGTNVVVYHHNDDDAPQNPKHENDVEFWEYWKGIMQEAVSSTIGCEKVDYIFSSEKYGFKLAEILDCKHFMVDNKREVVSISGTKIRNDWKSNYMFVNPHMMKYIRKEMVFFGAESVGKSTMTKIMGGKFKESLVCHEYARPYLEDYNVEVVTEEDMDNIFIGQNALELSIDNIIGGSPVTFMDTDIMSTFGYMRLMNFDYSQYTEYLPHKERIYFILQQDEVPFEADPIRYGGDHRESDDEFWYKVLEDFGIKNIHIIRGKTLDERISKVEKIVEDEIDKIFKFERE